MGLRLSSQEKCSNLSTKTSSHGGGHHHHQQQSLLPSRDAAIHTSMRNSTRLQPWLPLALSPVLCQNFNNVALLIAIAKYLGSHLSNGFCLQSASSRDAGHPQTMANVYWKMYLSNANIHLLFLIVEIK